jgi:plastocyanin
MKFCCFGIMMIVFVMSVLLVLPSVYAEEKTVNIPFGAYDPTFNTPVENWFEPPVITVDEGDTVTWMNNDQEGHTITSGKGAGRFGWMNGAKFGNPDGVFDSGRFMKGESWSYTFEKSGIYNYYCTIHPWMEGVVIVGQAIPDYPHDAFGNKIEKFPIVKHTADGLIEFDLTWEPNIIKTNEKTTFVYQTYDTGSNTNLDKMRYDIIIIQNGNEIFRDQGVTTVGGDFRSIVFDKPGLIEVRFENIQGSGLSPKASAARATPDNPSYRTVAFSTMVYENPEDVIPPQITVRPAKAVDLEYEIMLLIMTVPAAIFVGAIVYMKRSKPNEQRNPEKHSAI